MSAPADKFMIGCLDCCGESGQPRPIACDSPSDRAYWAMRHRAATGHERVVVSDPPEVAR